MDGHAGRDPDTDPPELTAAVLADLQAGLLDDATAARVRRRARDDPEAARTLARFDAVRGELARLGTDASSAPDAPPDVTAPAEQQRGQAARAEARSRLGAAGSRRVRLPAAAALLARAPA